MSPVVMIVTFDQILIIALDSNRLNDAIHKNKYLMQSIDHLMDKTATRIGELKTAKGNLNYWKIDLKYAYNLAYFMIPNSTATQTYSGKRNRKIQIFKWFLRTQKFSSYISKNDGRNIKWMKIYKRFLRRHNNCNKRSQRKHRRGSWQNTKFFDDKNLVKGLHKCQFGRTETIWLGYKLKQKGITPTKKEM